MRPIDAEAFEEKLEDFSFGRISFIYDNPHDKMVARHTVSEVIYLLDRAPIIEAKSVVHAHWKPFIEDVEIYNTGGYREKRQTGWICSKCGKGFTEFGHTKYCSDCGAQMDEEKNN